MAIHDPAVRINPDVSTSLAGRPQRETTRVPLHERLAAKLLPLMVQLSALGFLYVAADDLRGRSRRLRETREAVAEGENVSDDQLARRASA